MLAFLLLADIITLDPMGMFAGRPTQSATSANMSIPELQVSRAAGATRRGGAAETSTDVHARFVLLYLCPSSLCL